MHFDQKSRRTGGSYAVTIFLIETGEKVGTDVDREEIVLSSFVPRSKTENEEDFLDRSDHRVKASSLAQVNVTESLAVASYAILRTRGGGCLGRVKAVVALSHICTCELMLLPVSPSYHIFFPFLV